MTTSSVEKIFLWEIKGLSSNSIVVSGNVISLPLEDKVENKKFVQINYIVITQAKLDLNYCDCIR